MQGRKASTTDQEKRFAEAYALTGDVQLAAREAGYAHPKNAGKYLARPIVQAEIRRVQTERLYSDLLPAAIGLLAQVINDQTENTRNRITAAKIVLDRTLGAADAAADAKEPHEMTADELAARIARLRQRQAELADAARDITPAAPPEPDEEGGVFG